MTARALGPRVVLLEGEDTLHRVVFALAAAQQARRRNGMQPGAGHTEILAAVETALAADGLTDGPAEPVEALCETEVIGTEETAQLLGVSTRQVRRIATSLDGTRTRGGWIFHRGTINDYLETRRRCQTLNPTTSKNTLPASTRPTTRN